MYYKSAEKEKIKFDSGLIKLGKIAFIIMHF